MANSAIVVTLKENVINAICEDEDICSMIDSPHYTGQELRNTHIFDYNKNPETVTETITFLTLQINTSTSDSNGTYIAPKLYITVYTHNDHMPVIFGNKIQVGNRNDHLRVLLDEKFNGTYEYGGLGKLYLKSTTEGLTTRDFNYVQLLFTTTDFNTSLCERW